MLVENFVNNIMKIIGICYEQGIGKNIPYFFDAQMTKIYLDGFLNSAFGIKVELKQKHESEQQAQIRLDAFMQDLTYPWFGALLPVAQTQGESILLRITEIFIALKDPHLSGPFYAAIKRNQLPLNAFLLCVQAISLEAKLGVLEDDRGDILNREYQEKLFPNIDISTWNKLEAQVLYLTGFVTHFSRGPIALIPGPNSVKRRIVTSMYTDKVDSNGRHTLAWS